jgi:hypothetical protein
MNMRTICLCLCALYACNQPSSNEPAPAAEPAAPQPAAQPAPQPPPPPPVAALPEVPPGAKVFFIEPKDGAKIEGPLADGKVQVAVKMGAEGIAIKPAGPVEAGSGHHHILVDSGPLASSDIVPKDEQHLHFGQGQTEATLNLTPGTHTLQLQLADGMHRSYGPQLSSSIKITVVAAGTVSAGAKTK